MDWKVEAKRFQLRQASDHRIEWNVTPTRHVEKLEIEVPSRPKYSQTWNAIRPKNLQVRGRSTKSIVGVQLHPVHDEAI